MGRTVLKIDNAGEARFLVWSSIVDAPITFGLTADEIVQFFEEEAVEKARQDAATALERAREYGTSSRGGHTLSYLQGNNRAGPDESRLTVDEIIEFYVRRRQDPTEDALAEYRRKVQQG